MLKKNDMLLIVLVLLAAGGWWGAGWWQNRGVAAAEVQIWQDTVLVGTYPINGSTSVTVPLDSAYGHNLLMIENGTVRMLEADCPDQTCVHTGAVGRQGQTIVCLPNRVVVEIRGNGEVPIDDISQ